MGYISCSLSSLHVLYRGLLRGQLQGFLRGILGVQTMTHIVIFAQPSAALNVSSKCRSILDSLFWTLNPFCTDWAFVCFSPAALVEFPIICYVSQYNTKCPQHAARDFDAHAVCSDNLCQQHAGMNQFQSFSSLAGHVTCTADPLFEAETLKNKPAAPMNPSDFGLA